MTTILRPPTIPDFASLLDPAESYPTVRFSGRITKLVGLTLESFGPMASIGDLVEIRSADQSSKALAEVVGFRDERLLLMPMDSIQGVRCGDEVVQVNSGFTIGVGDALLGRVIDALGRPLDGKGPIATDYRWPVRRVAPDAMTRRRVTEPLFTGVTSIDATLTCGRGQRIGIFAGSGVGKSSVLAMICRNSNADLNVIALIGERGKEVRDFIENNLGEEGLARSVVVVVTSDRPPLQRVKGAETAMAIAEYFRDKGYDLSFLMDSVTRYAMAQREIGLAIGEPPATKGYPPSVFSLLPKLLERAGTNDSGSITAFCAVLVEGDDMDDPIADTVRGILDGHVVLSRQLAAQGHYPAVDILNSISRVMVDVTDREHLSLAQELRELLSVYQKAEDLVNIGAYKMGSNPKIDLAISLKPQIDAFLRQDLYDKKEWSERLEVMRGLLRA